MASPINEAAAGSSSSSLPRSSTDHQNHYRHQVFLSFRGDTRFNFTDHLYKALCDRGIKTFRDDDELRKGEEISPALLNAIEESRVSIVVFSQNYASSRWCLDELVKILECKSKGQQVKPVFYKVAPSHVRHQIGDFGDAFHKLEDKYKDSMGKWRKALKEAANLSGWTYKEDRYETEFIKDIVEELSPQLNLSCDWHVAEHQIGLKPCTQDVIRLLDAENNNMVGIWGPGGIGKTTIAKDVFNSIRHEFEGSYFLEEVRSNSNDLAKLACLQRKFLVNILREPNLKMSSVDEGAGIIKARMRQKKVLLILDDVSNYSQLQKLVLSPDYFGPGSKILITTRDKGWLPPAGVGVYEVKMLNDDLALELFSLHAFKSKEPPDDYLELARHAVHYAGGLPLALILLGSHLNCNCKSREEWEATLYSCKREYPYGEIRNILKISYDALGLDLQGYFLDIACFFKGKNVNVVKPILEACYDLKSVIGIKNLQEKALIRIDHETFNGGFIWMHDLIEEMGKDIVYQESPDQPEKRSRVWSEEDVNDVLTSNTGIKEVKGIQVLWQSSPISLNAKSFSGMEKLRYISMSSKLNYELISGDVYYLSKQLRWLDWPACPLQCFPSDFYANKLVHLNISQNCSITRLWKGRKNFPRLRCINLSGCTSLKELPDLSGIPILKELNLFWCTSLVEVPDSIQFLRNLETLDASGCSKLAAFPKIPVKMDSLRRLSLEGSDIRELDESIGNLTGLKYLDLTNCKNLTTLSSSIYGLQNLWFLDLGECSKLVRFPTNTKILNVDSCSLSLPKLQKFSVRGCSLLSDCDFLMTLDCWETLEQLDLSRNNFVSLPACLTKFVKLRMLDLKGCWKLREIPELPPSVVDLRMDLLRRLYLKDSDIRELDESIENLNEFEELDLSGCENLTTLPCSIYGLHNLKTLDASGCSKLATIPKIPVKMDSLRLLFLKGSDIRELDESIGNLTGLEYLDLTVCKNLTTLPSSIYGLQNLWFLDLGECSKLVRFPTNTEILNVDGRSLSLPRLGVFSIAGCSSLSDCDFLMTLDCWETLQWLNLSRNNFVSLPACLTKFVKLRSFDLSGCKSLRGIPELPPNVKPRTWGCESLEERSSTLTDPGAVIEAASPSIEEPTPSSGLSLSSEASKRHRTTEEPSPTPVNPPKRQRTAAGGQASMVHSAHEMAISPIPMIPDLQTHHFGWHGWRSYLLPASPSTRAAGASDSSAARITQLVRSFNTMRNQLSC